MSKMVGKYSHRCVRGVNINSDKIMTKLLTTSRSF